MYVEESDQERADCPGEQLWEIGERYGSARNRLLTFEEMVDLRAQLDKAIAMRLLRASRGTP